jgi:hypothetical protein
MHAGGHGHSAGELIGHERSQTVEAAEVSRRQRLPETLRWYGNRIHLRKRRFPGEDRLVDIIEFFGPVRVDAPGSTTQSMGRDNIASHPDSMRFGSGSKYSY